MGNQAAQALLRDLSVQVDSLRGGGVPLPESMRNFFEPRFGEDFSAVRVHTDMSAAETARSIDAMAFTRGQDIVFAQGQYQPGSFTGRKLLAHELTHVVQQGEGAGHGVAADIVQRACGPAEIGTAADCATLLTEPRGEPVAFRVNCDEFATADEHQKVRDFADSMRTTDRVRVHGFASMDGEATFNWDLSCARANRAALMLSNQGIPAGQIDVFAHGPTPGPVDQRRSVVLEMEGGVSLAPVPQLTATAIEGPTAGDCGEFNYMIMWDLSRNSHPVHGGYVVQEVTVTRVDNDCSGNPMPAEHPSPLHFFEAWRVDPGARTFDPLDTDTDRFWFELSESSCATGSQQVVAVATYYDNVAALPPGMVRNNPLTTGGGLRSSLNDPALTGAASRPVQHRLSVSWNCCPCRVAPTIIESHTP